MPKKIELPSDEIARMYADGESPRAIGARLGCSEGCIRRDLMAQGVQMRSGSEALMLTFKQGRKPASFWSGKKQPAAMVAKRSAQTTGSGNGRYKDGVQARPYRNLVVKKVCAECGRTENLVIHHIDFDHYNNEVENLQVLCNSCHISLHKTAYWEAQRQGVEGRLSNAPIGW